MRVAILCCFLIICSTAMVRGQVTAGDASISFIDLLRILLQRRAAQRQALSTQQQQKASRRGGRANHFSSMMRLMAAQGLLGEAVEQTVTFDCLSSGQMFTDVGCMMLTIRGL
ncbi:hypothetical protein CHS0354_022906 [Potamilus streckersoni]|uniref:Uncharacterized protein n=1 Tax=Potamilus streckersoni TaxID=2493646 RepID=A0AAE0VMZ6_9BIVA|nr:hypothetical protein CHS0354_022906 [Potamilus streckersoni]